MSHIENTQRLVEEISALKLAVKLAFIEGHTTANLHGYYDVKPLQSQNEALSAWDKSRARKAAEAAQ